MVEESEGRNEAFRGEPAAPRRSGDWAIIVAGFFAFALVASLIYGWHERNASRTLAEGLVSQRQDMSAALNQARSQIDTLTAKVNALSGPPTQPLSLPSAVTRPSASTSRHTVARRARVVEDRRLKKLQDQLAAQQKQIDSTTENLEQARTELANNLSSTKDELGGSIAKTHDELVALEKKGERNYYEFDLTKSKGFKRVGSLNLSLRKTNTRHDYFDVAMIVDDSTLDKKHVNLYEPVVVYPADRQQPLELVVNRINKNGIHGYISEPKYQESASAGMGAKGGTTSTGSATNGSPANTDGAQGSGDSAPAQPADLPHRPGPNI